jgi:hypothetical protein
MTGKVTSEAYASGTARYSDIFISNALVIVKQILEINTQNLLLLLIPLLLMMTVFQLLSHF